MRKRNTYAHSPTFPARLAALVIVAVTSFATTAVAHSQEETIVLGAEDGWRRVARFDSLSTRPGRRGYLDVALQPFRHEPSSTTELLLHFDELPLRDASGRYDVDATAPELTSTAQRTGSGALLVDDEDDRLGVRPAPATPPPAFAPGTEWSSFTIDFWLYPVVLSDGDSILRWHAREGAADDFRTQELVIEAHRGSLRARFENFFVRPDGSGVGLELAGTDRLIPRTWSHHVFRFDATTGLLEYLVDGSPVDLTYVSRTGRQDGTIYFPRIAAHSGNGLVLAEGFVGALDELRIERRYVDDVDTPLYAADGGSLTTDYIDLGSPGATLLTVDATTHTPGLSDVFLFYRLVNLRSRDPLDATGAADWTPVRPGDPVPAAEGRFLQLRAELLPDTREGLAPTLSQITVVYEPDPPPPSPTALRAVPGDRLVRLEWAPVQDPDIEGYLVYYGQRSGRYFGTESEQGASPVDVGPATSITVSGLENGTLYFFAVQAYSSTDDESQPVRSNELSTEVAARPARVYR
ncbi:MAG: fibronectin type III domain-containing protein [Spirochaetota bacterium]